MPVIGVEKDPANLTMTLTAEFAASPERVWQLWEDPRQLERWWGPPTHPATFTVHELRPGGAAAYHMTGPDGARYHGWWRILAVEPPNRIEFEDGFAHDDGSPNMELPTTISRIRIEQAGEGRTRMSIESVFGSAEAMEQVLAMGAAEGLTQAVGQIEAILAEDAATV